MTAAYVYDAVSRAPWAVLEPERAGIGRDDVTAVELNEAFAAQSLARLADWDRLDPERMNPTAAGYRHRWDRWSAPVGPAHIHFSLLGAAFAQRLPLSRPAPRRARPRRRTPARPRAGPPRRSRGV